MGGDDELGALLCQAADHQEGGELSLGGEGGFRLVQDEDAVAMETVLHQGQKALPMGLAVEGAAAVIIQVIDPPDALRRVVVHLPRCKNFPPSGKNRPGAFLRPFADAGRS